MREVPSISVESLRSCLQDHYAIFAATLDFLPLGHDTRAGVFRVVSKEGTRYLLKAKSGAFSESSCLVPRYLHDQGIASVVAPLSTKSNLLWASVGEWTIMLYPFIEGASGWDPPMTAEQWHALGAALRQIHQVSLPSEGLVDLRTETFDPSEYGRQLQTIDGYFAAPTGGSPSEQALRATWLAHQTTIHAAMDAMHALAARLRERSWSNVICHADLHPANILRDHADRVFVIDWDDVKLAPKERDFLFIEDAPVVAAAHPEASMFFQGYGQAEIDWTALTYYLWERAVTDLIEYARDVCFRPDIAEATKNEFVQMVADNLGESGYVSLARAAGEMA